MSLSEQFSNLLKKTSLTVTTEQSEKLLALVEMLNKWNKAYNLTSVRQPSDMLVRHIMDSIVLIEHLPQEGKLIDVGTGPGLPGLPLAICMPDVQFTLLDSLGKRIRFIRQVCYELEITNVTAIQSRVEEHQPDILYDGVLSRAFASLEDMLTWCHHLVPEDGNFYAMKGIHPDSEIDNLPTGFTLCKTITLNVPNLAEERHLLHIRKSS
ncbi:16S rRNA (guanine(527)-N(7))-methyltransferase RsmG [Algibacillus agarilyticus]|uniref:16S rRNA (guanine(527)-N(7))-methyltransferase RsmG n=1 Tax=Algibacillus agarilyticus TaxID=2234133 RepID=UPI000DD0695C|nr:16S rRNA (guanine(527)-N(7))-methyltransferase RsmG [Algibacillus agarilyticus]